MRKTALMIFKYAITAAVIACIIWKLGWKEIIATLAQAQPWWLLAALALFYHQRLARRRAVADHS